MLGKAEKIFPAKQACNNRVCAGKDKPVIVEAVKYNIDYFKVTLRRLGRYNWNKAKSRSIQGLKCSGLWMLRNFRNEKLQLVPYNFLDNRKFIEKVNQKKYYETVVFSGYYYSHTFNTFLFVVFRCALKNICCTN